MTIFLTGFGLGIAFVASPGAVTAQVIRRGLERGFRAAFSLQLGALIGMGLWAVVAFVGAAILAQNEVVQIILGLIAGLLLLYLATDALRAAYRGGMGEADLSDKQGDFMLGVALSLANPLPIAFWLGIGGNMMSSVSSAADVEQFGVFFVGFMLSATLWSLGLSSLLAWGRRFVRPTLFRVINAVGGLILGFFGVKLLWGVVIFGIN
jgi:threonine/homoserine/homoserine lactone efflux protein